MIGDGDASGFDCSVTIEKIPCSSISLNVQDCQYERASAGDGLISGVVAKAARISSIGILYTAGMSGGVDGSIIYNHPSESFSRDNAQKCL